MLNEKTKLVGLVYISNVLGGVAPVQQISEAAHKVRACRLFPQAPTSLSGASAAYCRNLAVCRTWPVLILTAVNTVARRKAVSIAASMRRGKETVWLFRSSCDDVEPRNNVALC